MMDDALRRRLNLGREHYLAKDYDTAEALLTEVVKEHRGFADIYNMLGVIWHDRGKLEEACDAFEQALRVNPSYTEAALNLSVTYNDLGRYADARDVYIKVIQRARAAPRSLDPFVKGKLANMHADLGAAYAESGLYHEAVREYHKALELCPTFVDLRTRLAALLRDMGDAAQAVRELEIVKTIQPHYVPARLALGTALHTLGRREDAIREWEAAQAVDPDNKAARLYLTMAREVDRPARPAPAATPRPPPPDEEPAELSEGSLRSILAGTDDEDGPSGT
jgi:tetratricopeptide (TPR) repeat protein